MAHFSTRTGASLIAYLAHETSHMPACEPGGKGAQGGDGEPQSLDDIEDLEGQGRRDGSGDRGTGGDPEGHSGARATEDQGGTGGREEPKRDGGTR